ncbi:MAG: HDOD domain-containing protein [Planctomycetaceae bacterium]|nr:HDOD domain-containing protein [Planctomycetaceae bacterium]
MSDHDELMTYLTNSRLCALPQSASEMIELSKDPSNGPKEYAEPISADMGLASQVLRFVNSSFFGFRFKITSVPMALTLVSVRTVRNFVLWNGLFAILPNPRFGPFSTKKLFLDSLRRAVFARTVAKLYTPIDGDEAFFCAMLQDIAIPILAQKWKSEYTAMIHQSTTRQVRLSTLEREKMNWDHSIAGGILAIGWNLGDTVANGIVKHTDTVIVSPTGLPSLDDIVVLSALLPKMRDENWHEAKTFVEVFHRMFGAKLTDLNSIFSNTDTDTDKLAALINLGRIPKKLSDYWQEKLDQFPGNETEDVSAFEEALEEYFITVC